ncbi:suppressor of SWI4 1 homolog [Mizuhopecten yessoensis]|uniref:Suppressor of SWI4 1-like n=1 Tax=Mizuhopecten yessoensis TaxID=6573 RepID=A0A210QCK0_MIZYE|nr:suppressor of SWI4 1 homolog [Mizuhopecten yessoensis]OWF46469.1 Suppressor of SWI4 1-like [Mizuhopecten yessoensis]
MGKQKKSKRQKTMKHKQLQYQEDIYTKAPHSFVFNRGHVGKNVVQLIKDMRNVMEPFTARNLKARKKNSMKDFVNIAGVLNVTHFLMLSKTEIATNLRVVRIPRGPTMTFKIHNYCLCKDVISSLRKPNLERKQFQYHPLLVMNNFGGDEMHTKLLSSMFQNMFPSINVNKVDLNTIRRCVLLSYDPETQLIEFRHYNIKVVPVGMTRAVKKLIKTTVPDMSKFEDISEYIKQGGNLSESEAELDGPENEVVLPQTITSRGNIKSTKSAIRMTELGPRLSLQLVKIEDGLCDGKVMYHDFIKKTDEELKKQKKFRDKKRKLKELRKKVQDENVQKKEAAKVDHKRKSIAGMKKAENPENEGEEEMDDAAYYKQEVGEEPEPELFSSMNAKRKNRSDSKGPPMKRMRTDKPFDGNKKMNKKTDSKFDKSKNFKSKDKVHKPKGKPGYNKKGKDFQGGKRTDKKFRQKR